MFMIVIKISVTITMIRWLCRLFARFQPMFWKAGISARQHHADAGDGQDAGEEVDPAGEPRVGLPGEVLRPLEDRAGHRVVARGLGERERDHMNCPKATSGQLQMKTPPMVPRPSANSVKMPSTARCS